MRPPRRSPRFGGAGSLLATPAPSRRGVCASLAPTPPPQGAGGPMTAPPTVAPASAGAPSTLADSGPVLETGWSVDGLLGGVDSGGGPPHQNKSVQWQAVGAA